MIYCSDYNVSQKSNISYVTVTALIDIARNIRNVHKMNAVRPKWIVMKNHFRKQGKFIISNISLVF